MKSIILMVIALAIIATQVFADPILYEREQADLAAQAKIAAEEAVTIKTHDNHTFALIAIIGVLAYFVFFYNWKLTGRNKE